jgi:hypothetical protein
MPVTKADSSRSSAPFHSGSANRTTPPPPASVPLQHDQRVGAGQRPSTLA